MVGLTFKLNPDARRADRTALGYDLITVCERTLWKTKEIRHRPGDHKPSPPGLAVPDVVTVLHHYTLHCLVVSDGRLDYCSLLEDELAMEQCEGTYVLTAEDARKATS
jgi:hypothetical protein